MENLVSFLLALSRSLLCHMPIQTTAAVKSACMNSSFCGRIARPDDLNSVYGYKVCRPMCKIPVYLKLFVL